MSTAPKQERYPSGGADSPGGGKPKGNRLARRARSFKEDFLGILSQMRSPGGSGTRSGSRAGSPSSPRPTGPPVDRPPTADMEAHVRQAQLALKHFRDVVAKDKLEMLPGNGTVVLETVTAIHVLLKKYLLNEQSSTLVSATNQVYQSLAKLIRLCDDYLLVGDKALGVENVSEVLQLVEDAIQNLVSLTMDKLAAKDKSTQHHAVAKPRALSDRPSLDATQRSSLPDIPLTPREREILEQTSAFVLERHSHSSENILRDDSPPPKPPHPDRVLVDGFPPPLPPKKRQKQLEEICGAKASLENLSLRSKSPGDSSSLFSASAGSLDSVLNHSREDELRHLLDDSLNAPYLNGSSNSCCYWDSASNTSAELKTAADTSLVMEKSAIKMDRLSGSQAESGFSSMPSRRSSSQSYSTSSQHLSSARSSQISHCSQESQTTERERRAVVNIQKIEGDNGSRLVTNGVSMSKQTTKSSYSSRSVVESCSCGHDAWFDRAADLGDVISYCPAHLPVSSRIENPLADGWSLFSSPSQEDDSPPPLPDKTRSRGSRRERHPSQYDNVPEGNNSITTLSSATQHSVASRTETFISGDEVDACQMSMFSSSSQEMAVVANDQGIITDAKLTDETKCSSLHHSKTAGLSEETLLRSEYSSLQTSVSGLGEGLPPPLPMKKKHIMAYMEMFGNASHGNTSEFLRHSLHVYQQRNQQDQILSSSINTHTIRSAHQSLDPHVLRSLPPALPPKRGRLSSNKSNTSSPPTTPVHVSDPGVGERCDPESPLPESPARSPLTKESPPVGISPSEPIVESNHTTVLDQLDISQWLILKKIDDDGPDIRGGNPDALVIHATKAHKNDFLYQEAFLTTYRTFMSPLELIQKLCYRYDLFNNSPDSAKQRAARESFSLLVRVVSDLTLSDVENIVLQTLMEFVQALLCRGDLTMAKALRVVMLAKYEAKKWHSAANNQLPSHHVTTRQSTLLEFKSEQIAEQMTLLDAELFLKIEIPEVLIWAQEQNEERSPNLTRFTEHFNKMSYWARSRILEQTDARERERYVVKFIKIMKHLRKINNFNSYLALLSALDSAPIRRLEWQKHITEGLKEYCALIDSSSSFRAYRQALAETQPPSIPYIGLVLQDLTFVHIGNNNLLQDGGINFSKRWQQYNIVENMKRFKKGTYPYKKNERIISFFNGFDESLSEEAMWQISEKIKPRGGKKL